MKDARETSRVEFSDFQSFVVSACESSAVFDLLRRREIVNRSQQQDNRVTKETINVSCQTKLPLRQPRLANLVSRRKIDLWYDDPKKPESGFYVCVVISGFTRLDESMNHSQREIKEKSRRESFFVQVSLILQC